MNCLVCGVSIDKHPANGCLDAWIAEKVMGGKWVRWHDTNYSDLSTEDGWVHATIILPKDFDFLCPPDYVEDTGECPRTRFGWIPEYSTDIAAAWEIVERMVDDYSCIISVRKIGSRYLFGATMGYAAAISGGDLSYERPDCALELWATTAPLALCRVVLRAIMEANND